MYNHMQQKKACILKERDILFFFDYKESSSLVPCAFLSYDDEDKEYLFVSLSGKTRLVNYQFLFKKTEIQYCLNERNNSECFYKKHYPRPVYDALIKAVLDHYESEKLSIIEKQPKSTSKECSCGVSYSIEDLRKQSYIGSILRRKGESIALFNCSACDSTFALKVG